MEFSPTILGDVSLLRRLVEEICYHSNELKNLARDFRSDPRRVVLLYVRYCMDAFRRLLHSPNALRAGATALLIIGSIVTTVFLVERNQVSTPGLLEIGDQVDLNIINLDLETPKPPPTDRGVGVGGDGRVGLNRDRGEGSMPEQLRSGGGGSGGNKTSLPVQRGKVPIPSVIQAAIPNAPLLNPPALPAAGMDLDPALWRDIKLPVYGDPRSKSEAASNGPGDGGGMGNNHGTGIGEGDGPGFGPGTDGNVGGGPRQQGCCGPGASSGDNPDGFENRIWIGPEVEQRPRILAKPEPQYTEEARRNQMMGTVVLRVVFSSSGEVTLIRAIRTLPFGLTERAITAARRIRFVPAMRGGRPVSVYMQLEYNFNLY